MTKKNPFKTHNNIHYLKGIFYELDTSEGKKVALYTLKDHEHKGYPSLRECYLSCEDPTEYTFAETYLDGWPHFKKLCACSWFMDYLKEWREELEVKLRSKSLANIHNIAKNKDSKEHYQASKFLVDKGWEPKAKAKTGPKTREKIREEAEKISNGKVEILDDWKRLNLGEKPN